MNLMLAKAYTGQDVSGWLMSEKLDGVRAFWDGKQLVSRRGNTFAAPQWFLAQLPCGIQLDGELFIGRGQFQQTVSVVRSQTADWSAITYRVFDAPAAVGGFEQRLDLAERAIAASTVASIVPQIVCRDRQHLDAVFADMVGAGAEGIMLRAPGSAYEPRRSSLLLKYKPYDSDEATIISYEAGAGKYVGMIGALVCRWKDKTFCVGSGLYDELRAVPPAIGAIITFGYCGLTDAGLPRFPTFIDVRNYE